ncbi:MAG TPA: F0F1 ATP synthase subunit A [Stellaceae bacterium]|nr:F0F1 ATP synthase subunit A [Stellaceae bacterium]
MAVAETSPLHQFTVESLVPIHVGTFNLSFSNSALFMVIAVALITAFLVLSTRGARLVPTRWQSLAELSYEFVAGMVRENVGHEGRPYFPFVFSIFMFVLFGNLISLIPGSFAFTAHIVVTFALALTVFIAVTLVGFIRHGFHFLSFFVPRGMPALMVPLMVPIEILSYLFRPISLSVRLFANMMAGHTMLLVFAGFILSLGVFGVLPLAIDVALILFEVLVAVLQAYVFAILTCLYFQDAIHLH